MVGLPGEFVAAALGVGGAISVVACVQDCRSRRISNWLCLWLLAAGLVGRGLFFGFGGFGTAMLGVLVGFLLLVVPFGLGMMGGGDLKFLAAWGAWLGPVAVIWAVVVAFVVGALMAVGIRVWSRSGDPGRRTVPYGVALSVGSVVALVNGVRVL